MAEIVESIEGYSLSKRGHTKALFSKVGLIGPGPVGQTIARMISQRGMDVVFIEANEKKANAFIKEIGNELEKMIGQWGMTSGEKTAIVNRIKGSADWKDLKDCDMVIEALDSHSSRAVGVEHRKQIFKEIEKHISYKAIIATNSTSLMTTELMSELDHPERGISFHFLVPSADAPVVEVVRGIYTSDEVYDNVMIFARLIGKEVIPVFDFAGKISTRMIIPLINEACEAAMEGVGKKEDIDKIMRLGYDMKLGPFEMADRIGLDNIVRWMENLYDEFGDLKYKPSPMIKKLVRANYLGVKTGKGFYDYTQDGKTI
jgi:3-hydroxybutyryl-CoA dehydrogenase